MTPLSGLAAVLVALSLSTGCPCHTAEPSDLVPPDCPPSTTVTVGIFEPGYTCLERDPQGIGRPLECSVVDVTASDKPLWTCNYWDGRTTP